MAIVVKMAQLSLIESQTDSFPLLLLDEVFAELDNQKKEQLIPFITRKTQCVFATIQPEDQTYFESVNVYEMKDGTLISHG
jgi:DNA replication and repair protein RecF